jgi:hypothetical protein
MNDMFTSDPAAVRQGEQPCIPARTIAVRPGVSTALERLAKGFTLALAVIASLSAAPHPATADEAPIAFIRDFGNQALAVIRSDMPLAGKAAYFERMIRQDFDLTGISRFELGPYWRIASPAERRESSDLFAIASFTSMGDGSRNSAMGVSS